MNSAVRANGKQLMLGKDHLADCRDEDTAYILSAILDGEHSARLLAKRDPAKIDTLTAILSATVGLIVGVGIGAALL